MIAERPVNERLRAFGLLPAEYDQIVGRLGRQPNLVELGMLGAMWSEHCGYKHSRRLLKRLPTSGARVLQGPGENAGAVDIGNGLAVVLKMESHNHPSAVEPFQGAATGVGGILRDIFTMGARPIAILNSLRFGAFDDPRTQYLLGGVVGGIGAYGNCLPGDERLVWRTADGKIHFGTIADFVESRLEPIEAGLDLQADLDRPEALSVDLANGGLACWRPIRRVFKREAKEFVQLKTALGRRIRLTPDHPVLIYDNGWRYQAARSLKRGDLLAITLPIPQELNDRPEAIDLIALLRERPSLAAGVWVQLPARWAPTDELRVALRRIEPHADRRCACIKRGRFPWRQFLELEPMLGVARAELRLLRQSGKANLMNAVIRADERFARLLGYFASEGCVSRNARTDVVAFTFARHEHAYVEDVCSGLEALGLRPRRMDRASTIAVYVTSWLLGGLLRDVWNCGSNSLDKAVPGFVFGWPLALQFEVLKGLFRGDGCLTGGKRNRAKISFASSSRTLFEQTLALLHNRRIVPACHLRPGLRRVIEGRPLVFASSWHLEVMSAADLGQLRGLFSEDKNDQLERALAQFARPDLSRPRKEFRGNHALVAVNEVERPCRPDVGEFVYDIEVEDTHCFVSSGGLTLHNCFGCPTVGGEISFDAGYAGNPIVNAMAVGMLESGKLTRARASGPGNVLLLVGADTGSDGLQGAAFASNEDPEVSHRGVVQVGNPFLEKLLLEACLAIVGSGEVLAMQDLGAAGLTSSAVEMAARGGLGVDLDVARVPRREAGLTPFEVMLSESQERMLLLVRSGSEAVVQAHFARWELHAAAIGTVTAEPTITVRDGQQVVAELPIALLTDDVPAYDLQVEAPPSPALRAFESTPSARGDVGAELLKLLATPNLRSRRFAFRQYDSTVQGNTVLGPGHAAAVIRVEGTRKGLALTTDCNPRLMRLDPRRGAMQAVAEAARNLACVGAEPIAVTDCLNFGNPEKPRVAWQLTQAIDGLAEACCTLDVPIVSGNVSLYNEAAGNAIPPTPTVGMVGLLEDVTLAVPTGFQPDSVVVLLGHPPENLGASEYLPDNTGFPRFELDAERRLHALLRSLAERRLLRSAQDISDGGLAVALAECAMLGACGAILRFEHRSMEVALFSEDQGRAVVSCAHEDVEAILASAADHRVTALSIGRTGGDQLIVEEAFDLSIDVLRAAWDPEG